MNRFSSWNIQEVSFSRDITRRNTKFDPRCARSTLLLLLLLPMEKGYKKNYLQIHKLVFDRKDSSLECFNPATRKTMGRGNRLQSDIAWGKTMGRGNWLQSDITRGKNILVLVESYNDGQWMTMGASWLCQLRLKPVLLSNSNTVVTFSFVILYIMTSRVSLCLSLITLIVFLQEDVNFKTMPVQVLWHVTNTRCVSLIVGDEHCRQSCVGPFCLYCWGPRQNKHMQCITLFLYGGQKLWC